MPSTYIEFIHRPAQRLLHIKLQMFSVLLLGFFPLILQHRNLETVEDRMKMVEVLKDDNISRSLLVLLGYSMDGFELGSHKLGVGFV